jgi:predicted lipoprotein with Yx(FWY)xxD motif
MKTISMLLVAGLLLLAGCGDDDDDAGTSQAPPKDDAAMQKEKDDAAMQKEKDDAAMQKEKDDAAMSKGTTITLGDSEFGSMLFDSKKQAIYIFERDTEGKSACYDECAEAWPPVYTDGEPQAGKGVKQSLLGTIERRDGRKQVTYAGQPLYFYAHEAAGEVKCHNVNLNVGLWWVVGPDGKRRS